MLGHTPHRCHCRSHNPFASSVKVTVRRACIICRSPTPDLMWGCCYFFTRTMLKHLLQDKMQSLVEINSIWPQSCGHGNLYGNIRNPYYITTTFSRRIDNESNCHELQFKCPHVLLKIVLMYGWKYLKNRPICMIVTPSYSSSDDSPRSLSNKGFSSSMMGCKISCLCTCLPVGKRAKTSSGSITWACRPSWSHVRPSPNNPSTPSLHASLPILRPLTSVLHTTFQPGHNKSLDINTCCTWMGNAKDFFPYGIILLKLAIVSPKRYFFTVALVPA